MKGNEIIIKGILHHNVAGTYKPYTIQELGVLVMKLRKRLKQKDKEFCETVFTGR